MGRPSEQQRRMYAAVFEARQAALAAIRPSVKAADVDRAARKALDGARLR
jgi:Xaa-Pro aminopeptidase/Xaa-Pro dipeptidase